MTFDPDGPTLPWREEVSGYPFMLMGSSMTTLVNSTYWKENISVSAKDTVTRTVGSAKGGDIDKALSAEVFTSLLCRFASSKGYSILGTWDPYGVVQSAAIELMLPSVCFLGLSRKQQVWKDESLPLPILGWRQLPHASAFEVCVVKPTPPETTDARGKKRKL